VWAADNGANVINMSLGSFGGNPDGTGSAAQQTPCSTRCAKTCCPSAPPATTTTSPNGYTGGVGYPARFPECMAVGATNWSDRKASYSNYGAQIEISAPGGDSNAQGTAAGFILAPLHSSNSYTWKTGTSMATPQVAGLAALLYATGKTTAAESVNASRRPLTTSRRRAGTIGRAQGASTCTVRSPGRIRTRGRSPTR
jgi:serine protease